VLLEALATARPVVSTRVSGIPEIVVDGVTGLLVPPGDAAALADALALLLTDPDRARAMGVAGRQRATELFDLWANAAVLQQHFDSIRSRGVPA
jgi:glycosyltransferase involved in cell wall biosynthesis